MTGTPFYPLIASGKDGSLTLKNDSWILGPIKWLGKYLEVYSYRLPAVYNHLIYIDINAGTGLIEVNDSKGSIYDSSLIALASPVNFNRYIFWEPSDNYSQMLRIRVNKNFKDKNTLILGGSQANMLKQLRNYIPMQVKGIRPWIFCNIHPRFGRANVELLAGLMKFGSTIFLNITQPENPKEGWKLLSKSVSISPEYKLRLEIKELESWALENEFELKGSFQRIEASNSFSLIFSGLLSQNRAVSKIIKEVEKDSAGQLQLFV